jgi:hypothetical protein
MKNDDCAWNEAIEAAAKYLESKSDYPEYAGDKIRKLKRNLNKEDKPGEKAYAKRMIDW